MLPALPQATSIRPFVLSPTLLLLVLSLPTTILRGGMWDLRNRGAWQNLCAARQEAGPLVDCWMAEKREYTECFSNCCDENRSGLREKAGEGGEGRSKERGRAVMLCLIKGWDLNYGHGTAEESGHGGRGCMKGVRGSAAVLLRGAGFFCDCREAEERRGNVGESVVIGWGKADMLRLRGGWDFYHGAGATEDKEEDSGQLLIHDGSALRKNKVDEGREWERGLEANPYALDAVDLRSAEDMGEWVHQQEGKIFIDAHEKEVKAMLTLKRENDEELLITADGMGLILVWETDSFQCKQILRGHIHGIQTLALSHDKSVLYSGGWDCDIWAWNTHTWKGKKVVRGVGMVSYEPCEINNPEAIISFPGHDAPVLCVCAVSVGMLASGDMHGRVCVWDASTWNRVATLFDHEGEVWCVAEHNGTNVLMTAGEDWNVNMWDKATWALLCRWEGHTGPVRSLLTIGDLVLSGSQDCSVRVWSPLTGVCAMEMSGYTGWVLGLCVSRDCEKVYVACSDGSVYVRETLNWNLLREETGHEDYCTGVSLVRDDNMVASCSYDYNVMVRRME